PAACALVGAMNPCPCGYLGHPEKNCRCLAVALDHYRSRISGPLLDRLEVLVEVPPLSMDSLEAGRRGEPSEVIRARVVAARAFCDARLQRDHERNGGPAGMGRVAWDLERGRPHSLELRGGTLTPDARSLLRHALVKEGLSGRAYTRIIDLARTIADLDNLEEVGVEHVAEALSLRLDYRRLALG
ncbi:MAG TPA: ATP-binding protein, partial [Thermoleophilia bacterium]|nr:ATP-binding protein [Thermoleophilia bacterium]